MKNLVCASALGLLAMVTVPAAQAATWEHVTMVKGPNVKTDLLNIWTSAQMSEALEEQPIYFYTGRYASGSNTVIISMMYARAMCGMQNCPVRIMLQPKNGKTRLLLDENSTCSGTNLYSIKSDLSAFKACDAIYPLKIL